MRPPLPKPIRQTELDDTSTKQESSVQIGKEFIEALRAVHANEALIAAAEASLRRRQELEAETGLSPLEH